MSDDHGGSLPALLLLSYGWDYGGWSDFYPDDLPDEWRLTYYANEYRGVLVPQERWSRLEDVEQWRDDVHGGFRFVLEYRHPSRKAEALLHGAIDLLADRFAGVLSVVSGEGFFRTETGSFHLWVEYGEVGPGVDCPCCVTNPSWVGGHDSVRAFRFDSSRRADLKQLRQIAETLEGRGDPDFPSLLIVDGDPPVYSVLHECQIMLNLMGLA